MHFHAHLNAAKQILSHYIGNDPGAAVRTDAVWTRQPFASFLKKYFSVNRKHGSRDRKVITQLCYCYFRLGKSLTHLPIEERMLIGLFFCSNQPNDILGKMKPAWDQKANLPLNEKAAVAGHPLALLNVFPWQTGLSAGIDFKNFNESFFVQPDLFLRLRPGHENIVKEKLSKRGIEFSEISSTCVSMSNSSKIEDIIELDIEAVVQDYSSQRIMDYLKLANDGYQLPNSAWDCCSGSGGKSLLLHDLNPQVDLTVSDMRESILANLKKRFSRAGIRKYRSFVIDVTEPNPPPSIRNARFDLIICDAPCTGSGTWGRTPEQLYLFEEKKIDHYAQLQKKIVSNVGHYLTANGWLIYITCSVFKKENEDIVEFIKKDLNLKLIEMATLKGYDKKADTMFVALCKNIKT